MGMLLLAMIPLGIYASVKAKGTMFLPLSLVMGAILASQVVYVLREPFSCNLDFRYFVVLTVPIAALAVSGAERLGVGGRAIVGLFCMAALSFLFPLLYA